MFPKSAFAWLLTALGLTSACTAQIAPKQDEASRPASEAEYAAPPQVTAVRLENGTALVRGLAVPGAQVRAAAPGGVAVLAQADNRGGWALRLPVAGEGSIFGVSEFLARRRVQAQGYLFISPEGHAALLQAGGGAVRLDRTPAPAIGAVDFDGAGGAVVSGVAPPQAWLILKLDGRQIAQARAEEAGRYAITLPHAIARGAHLFEVTGDGFALQAKIEATPAVPLAGGPMRSQLTSGGRRVDWLTPGGGVQSTIVLN